jgi:hypothetical protein
MTSIPKGGLTKTKKMTGPFIQNYLTNLKKGVNFFDWTCGIWNGGVKDRWIHDKVVHHRSSVTVVNFWNHFNHWYYNESQAKMSHTFTVALSSMNEWVLITTCKHLVWSTRIGRSVPIWICVQLVVEHIQVQSLASSLRPSDVTRDTMIIMFKDVERCRKNMDSRFYSIVSLLLVIEKEK